MSSIARLIGSGLAAAVLLLGLAPLPDVLPPPRLVPSALVTTVVVLVGTGAVAGVAPGLIAARVDPSIVLIWGANE